MAINGRIIAIATTAIYSLFGDIRVKNTFDVKVEQAKQKQRNGKADRAGKKKKSVTAVSRESGENSVQSGRNIFSGFGGNLF